MSNNKIFFPNLDGLRFLAFLGVFLAHTFFSNLEDIQLSQLYQWFRFVSKHGALGVNFFFVLSGFLITYLLLNEKKVFGQVNVGRFYLRRILRIWPLYYSVVFVGYFAFPIVQGYFGKQVQETHLVYYLFFISNYLTELPQSAILGILWSIAVEEQFYLIWPLIFLLPSRQLPRIYLLILLISFIARTFFVIDVHANSLSCMSDLTVGAWLAQQCFEKKPWTEKLSMIPRQAIILCYCGGMLLIGFKESWSNVHLLHNNERFLFSLFFAFVIFDQNYCKHSFFKMSNWKLASNLGKVTYGLYLLHFIAIYLVYKILTLSSLNEKLWQVLFLEPVIALLVSIVLAKGSYALIERPFLRLKRKFA